MNTTQRVMYYSPSRAGFFDSEIHSALPDDAVEITAEQHAELLQAQSDGQRIVHGDDGRPIAVDRDPPTPEQLSSALSRTVQRHLDATAASLGYDSIAAAISYAEEPIVPTFQAEGRALRAWRSQVWAAALSTINATKGGAPAPERSAFVATLPAFAGA